MYPTNCTLLCFLVNIIMLFCQFKYSFSQIWWHCISSQKLNKFFDACRPPKSVILHYLWFSAPFFQTMSHFPSKFCPNIKLANPPNPALVSIEGCSVKSKLKTKWYAQMALFHIKIVKMHETKTFKVYIEIMKT